MNTAAKTPPVPPPPPARPFRPRNPTERRDLPPDPKRRTPPGTAAG
jgi:hypothetical protein